MRRLILLGLAGLLVACTTLLGVPEKPKVALAGIVLEDLGLFEQRFQLALRVSNPNDTELTIDGLDFKLELNGKAFASGESREAVTLPRKGDVLVKLKVKTRLVGILDQIKLLQTGEKPLSYRMLGRLYTPWLPGGIAFERKGELPRMNQIFPDLQDTEKDQAVQR